MWGIKFFFNYSDLISNYIQCRNFNTYFFFFHLGKYVPAISYRIHQMNKMSNSPIKMPLKGLAIGDGLCDPPNQMDYGDFLYQGTDHLLLWWQISGITKASFHHLISKCLNSKTFSWRNCFIKTMVYQTKWEDKYKYLQGNVPVCKAPAECKTSIWILTEFCLQGCNWFSLLSWSSGWSRS